MLKGSQVLRALLLSGPGYWKPTECCISGQRKGEQSNLDDLGYSLSQFSWPSVFTKGWDKNVIVLGPLLTS